MARTDQERLDYLLELRDALEDAITASGGKALKGFTIRGRRMDYEDPIKMLEWVEDQIAKLKTALDGRGHARAKVRLVK